MELKKFLKTITESEEIDYVMELKSNDEFKAFVKQVVTSKGEKAIKVEFQGPKGEMTAKWSPNYENDELDIDPLDAGDVKRLLKRIKNKLEDNEKWN